MVALLKQSNIIPFPACDAPTQGKSNEWYTPAYIIEAARKVLGTIDLDPASCEQANQVVRATRFYSAKDNGLAQEWRGNVWLNPPYGRVNGSGASVIRMFVTKLVDEYETGKIEQAILLTTVQTNCTWFQLLWNYLICFTDSRVHFIKPMNGILAPDGRTSHTLGTALVYLGPNEQAFIDNFRDFGHIAKSIAGPRRDTVQATLWEGNHTR